MRSVMSLRLARDKSLDDAQLRALQALDDEAGGLDGLERLAREVVVLEAQEEGLQQPLYDSYGEQRAAYVLEEHEPAAGTQDAHRFGDGGVVVGDGAQGQRARDGVE